MSLKINNDTYTLNNNNTIPVMGFGTMLVDKPQILESIKAGYRQLDSAKVYKNEVQVGEAIKESGVPREDLFVTTKLWNTDHKTVAEALDESLQKLNLDYVDLYLIHWPSSEVPELSEFKVYDDWDFVDTYKELQKIVKTTNKIKNLGVSNFTIDHFEKLFADKEVDIIPVVNQIEAHPLLIQQDLVDYMTNKNIAVQAYSPLGGSGNFVFQYDEVKKLAEKYNVETAQILNSWAVQRNSIVIPRTNTPKRIYDNLKTLVLEEEDFQLLNTLEGKYGTVRNNDAWRFA